MPKIKKKKFYVDDWPRMQVAEKRMLEWLKYNKERINVINIEEKGAMEYNVYYEEIYETKDLPFLYEDNKENNDKKQSRDNDTKLDSDVWGEFFNDP